MSSCIQENNLWVKGHDICALIYNGSENNNNNINNNKANVA